MMKNIRLFALFCLLVPVATAAGGQNVTLQGVVNRYATVMAYDSCTGMLSVSDTAGFRTHDIVLIAHSQGVAVGAANAGSYGSVTAAGHIGRIEEAEIAGRTATALQLKHRLLYPPQSGTKVQVVSFPHYTSAVVTDTVKAQPWDGQKGGIIAFSVSGTLTMNAPVDASGAGFRGGASFVAGNNNCSWALSETAYFYAAGNWRGGPKGEGAALPLTGHELGRGARANGGGGGNDHNSGGGGGANIANGGGGGNNDEPSAFGCDGQYPGIGGYGFLSFSDRFFFGGGGGAGHSNNTATSDGGNGGGIIVVSAGNVTGSMPHFLANGRPGRTSTGDGGGGGGAGGTVWMSLGSVGSGFMLTVNGGKGGDASGTNGNRCFGPGGGGGGGHYMANLTPANISLFGGISGTVFNSTNACNGNSNGATAGAPGTHTSWSALPRGTVPAVLPQMTATPLPVTACEGETAFFTVVLEPDAPVQWQQAVGAGWVNIAGATSDSLWITAGPGGVPANFRAVADGGACYQLISPPASLTVLPLPAADFSGLLQAGSTWSFEATTQYTTGEQLWDFGDNTTSSEINPVHTFVGNGVFPVSLTVWNDCDTVTVTREVMVMQAPTAVFSVADTIASCHQAMVQFTNESAGAQQYTWSFPGGQPATSTAPNPTVLYTSGGNYNAFLTATNAAGNDMATASFVIDILPFPTANWTWVDQPGGPTVAFTFTGADALLYQWDFGDGSPVSNAISPVHTFPPGTHTYMVRLQVINSCGASVLEQPVLVNDETVSGTDSETTLSVKVFPNPAKGAIWVQCPVDVQRIELFSLTGALLKQWMPGSNTVQELPLGDLPAMTGILQVLTARGPVRVRVTLL